MSVAPKLEHINTHVVDILGSTKGRDQPIMKMDKAVQLVECLEGEVLTSDDYVFLDPFSKAGEILLATALVSTAHRQKKELITLDQIKKKIYTSNRYFALAPDERHFYLSRRTFYGNERSHQMKENHNIRNGAYLSEVDGRLDQAKFQKELEFMLEYIKEKTDGKKIVAVGNPPYQEEDGGHGRSARPIYNILIDTLVDSNYINQFLFVIPSRWFSGGKGLDNFREKMIKSGKIKNIRHFENPHHIFPTVEIRGGICFLHWVNKNQEKTILNNGIVTKEIDLSRYDIIMPHVQAYSILKKVFQKKSQFLDSKVWSRRPFGLESNYFKVNKKFPSGTIECFCEGKQVKKVSEHLVSKNSDKIDLYKVAFPEASGGGKGKRDKILPRPEHFFILDRGQISTETYSIAGSFKTLQNAKNYLSFIQTSFALFLLGLRKPTQHTSKKTFAWVPLMDMNTKWTDEKLFDYFGITKKEEKYIKDKVDYWTA